MVLIKTLEDAEKMAATLRALGWIPSVGMMSRNEQVCGFSIGVVVPVGDDRIRWKPVTRNPLTDFFSIANVAARKTENVALAPVGFEWDLVSLDSVRIGPNAGERASAFFRRLQQISIQHADKNNMSAAFKSAVQMAFGEEFGIAERNASPKQVAKRTAARKSTVDQAPMSLELDFEGVKNDAPKMPSPFEVPRSPRPF